MTNNTMGENKNERNTIFLVLLGSTITGIIVLFGLIAYMRSQEAPLQADTCAVVEAIHADSYVHMRIVRGYNEYWDQLVGTAATFIGSHEDVRVGYRYTLTARTVWGQWDVDWETPYRNCPEAFSGTGQ